MDIFTERFNEVIRYELVNQSHLATKIGISRQCISDYKSGKSYPTIQTLSSICKILDVSANYLLGLEDDFGTRTSAATSSATASNSAALTTEERKILEQYRNLPEQLRKLVRQQLEVYNSSEELLFKPDKKV